MTKVKKFSPKFKYMKHVVLILTLLLPICVLGCVEEEKVKKAETKFETSYIPNGFRLGNGYYFSVTSIEPLTNIQDMLFNIPNRPEIPRYWCPLVSNLKIVASTNMNISYVSIEYYDFEEKHWLGMSGLWCIIKKGNISEIYFCARDGSPGDATNIIGIYNRTRLRIEFEETVPLNLQRSRDVIILNDRVQLAVEKEYTYKGVNYYSLTAFIENISIPTVLFELKDVKVIEHSKKRTQIEITLKNIGSLALIGKKSVLPGPFSISPKPEKAWLLKGNYVYMGAEGTIYEGKEFSSNFTMKDFLEAYRCTNFYGGHDVFLPKPYESYLTTVILQGEEFKIALGFWGEIKEIYIETHSGRKLLTFD